MEEFFHQHSSYVQYLFIIICVVFNNMFYIFKDPNGNKPFLGLSWAILGIYVFSMKFFVLTCSF